MTDSFGARKSLAVRSTQYQIYRLDAVKGQTETLPYTLKILLENLLRFEDVDALRKALRAERAIGITVVSTSDGYRIVATDVRWNDAAPGGRLPSATGDDMAAAARALAQRLVSDSTAQSRTRSSGR
jgi:hypothetical protein